MDKITHTLCSPLIRTLETALEYFKPLFERILKIIAWERLIETGASPCSWGDKLPDLREKMTGWPVDIGLPTDGWVISPNSRLTSIGRPTYVAIRLYKFCQGESSLFGDPVMSDRDVGILVISHGSFLRYLISEREHLGPWLYTQ